MIRSPAPASIHLYFTKINDGSKEYRQCKLCSKRYKLSTANTNLVHHLKSQHINKFIEFEAAKVSFGNDVTSLATTSSDVISVASSSCSQSSIQTTLTSSVRHYQSDYFIELFAKCFAKCSLSLRLVECQEFIDLIHASRLCNIPIPNRKQLAKAQQALAVKITQETIEKIASCDLPITIALDAWENCNHSKVINILLISSGIPYFYKSIENKYHSTTAEWMFENINPILNHLKLKCVKVAGITMDNASVNVKLFRLLQAEHPHLIHVPCAAHVINLCVKKVLEIDGIRDVVKILHHILKEFQVNSNLTLKLRRLQMDEETDISVENIDEATVGKAKKNSILELVRPTDTR